MSGTGLRATARRPDDDVVPDTETAGRNRATRCRESWLADESDVERYLDSMRKALLDDIRKGKRIQI